MDGRSRRSFPRRRAGPRQRHHRADGAGRGRQVSRDGCRSDGRHGRLSLDLRAVHSVSAAPACCRASTTSRRSIAASARCSPTPCRSMPIAAPGRPEAAYVDRAAGRCLRAQARHDAGCDPRARTSSRRSAMPYTTATGKVYDSGDFTAHMKRAMEIARLEGVSQARQGREEGRPGSRHRHGDLCRGLRHDGRGNRQRRARSERRHHRSDRLAIDRAGPSDRLCAARRRAVRRPAGARPRRAGRHRQGRDRPRHRRLGFDPVRRRQRRSAPPRSSARICKEIAAEALEAGAGDLEISDGAVRVAGTDRSISFADLAKRPGVDPSKLNASETFAQRRRHLSERHASRRSRDRSGDRQHRRSSTTSSSTISA